MLDCGVTPRRSAALVLSLVLVGCGAADEDGTSAPAPTSSPSSTASAAASPQSATSLVLFGDGLGVKSTGGVVRLAFGTPGSAAQQAVADVFGPDTPTTNEECGGGPLVIYGDDGFQVLLDGQTFVGWVADERVPAAKAAGPDGTAVGMTLGELRSLHPDVTVVESTLGQELALARTETSVGGFLEGEAGAGTVTGLYAGLTCFFR